MCPCSEDFMPMDCSNPAPAPWQLCCALVLQHLQALCASPTLLIPSCTTWLIRNARAGGWEQASHVTDSSAEHFPSSHGLWARGPWWASGMALMVFYGFFVYLPSSFFLKSLKFQHPLPNTDVSAYASTRHRVSGQNLKPFLFFWWSNGARVKVWEKENGLLTCPFSPNFSYFPVMVFQQDLSRFLGNWSSCKNLNLKSFSKGKQSLTLHLFFSILDFCETSRPAVCGFLVDLGCNGKFRPRPKTQWWPYVKLLINWTALLPCDWYLAPGSDTTFPQGSRNIIYDLVTEIWLLFYVLVRLYRLTFINDLVTSQRTERT